MTQGLILSHGRGNSRDKMLIMRACLQTSVISFAVDVWSRHATGGENALRDEIKQLKTMIAKKKELRKKKKESLYTGPYGLCGGRLTPVSLA